MSLYLLKINWLAVATATIAYCAFSGVWHSQFAFGKKWESAMGFKRPENWKETAIYYIVPSISCFVTSSTIAILLQAIHVTTLNEALTLGLISGVGFATAATFTNAVIPIMKKPLTFGIITGAAHAVGITLATIIIYLIS